MATANMIPDGEPESFDLPIAHPLGPDTCETLQEIDLSKVVVEAGTQPREEIDPEVVKEFTEAWIKGADFPPIRVVYDRIREIYICWDGLTRSFGAKRAGKKKIKAYVRQDRIVIGDDGKQASTAVKDAVLLSTQANWSHGQRRKPGDVRRAIRRLFSFPVYHRWCDTTIADYVHCSSQTVGSVRREMGINPPGDGPRVREKKMPDGSTKLVTVVSNVRTPKAEPIQKETDDQAAEPAINGKASGPTIFKPSQLGKPTIAAQRTASTPLFRLEAMLKKDGVTYEMNVKAGALGHVHALDHTKEKAYWAENTFNARQVCEFTGRMLVLRTQLGPYKGYKIVLAGDPDAEASCYINLLKDMGIITYRALPK